MNKLEIIISTENGSEVKLDDIGRALQAFQEEAAKHGFTVNHANVSGASMFLGSLIKDDEITFNWI